MPSMLSNFSRCRSSSVRLGHAAVAKVPQLRVNILIVTRFVVGGMETEEKVLVTHAIRRTVSRDRTLVLMSGDCGGEQPMNRRMTMLSVGVYASIILANFRMSGSVIPP